MVVGGGEKGLPLVTRNGFTLIELVIAMSLMSSLAAFTIVNGASILEKYSNPRSEYRIAIEVERASEWIEGVLKNSLDSYCDVRFTFPYENPAPNINIFWLVSSRSEEWASKSIEFMTRVSPGIHTYSHSSQTLTPALVLYIHTRDERGNSRMTDWRISISGYGFVRAYRG
jgi:prepilin-type N-terminal cleavage/methylation domain-containing protein